MTNPTTDNTPKSAGIRVFVYGTLKMGHGNHPALEGSRFLGRCSIKGNWSLRDLGPYPCVAKLPVPKKEKNEVYGEVYLVDEDTLYTLDLIEGHPDYYTREKVSTPWKGAWCYFLSEDHAERGADSGNVWCPMADEAEYIANERG